MAEHHMEGGMADQGSKQDAFGALVDRVVRGQGRASAEQRAKAFSGDGGTAPLATLVRKVTARPVRVTDADVAAVKASGMSEDEVFELVVCAAVGHSSRLFAAGLAALDAVGEDGIG
jgi:hypothetical protein